MSMLLQPRLPATSSYQKQRKNEESTNRRIINHHRRRIGTLDASLVFAVQEDLVSCVVARFSSRGS